MSLCVCAGEGGKESRENETSHDERRTTPGSTHSCVVGSVVVKAVGFGQVCMVDQSDYD